MIETVNQYLPALSFLFSTGALLVAFFGNRRKYVDDRFQEGSKRMDRHDLRIQSLEDAAKVTPGKDELHALQLELVGISGTMEAIKATMDGQKEIMGRLEKIVGRHEDHLLSGSKS